MLFFDVDLFSLCFDLESPTYPQEWQFIEKHLARMVKEPVCNGRDARESRVFKRLISPWGLRPLQLPLPTTSLSLQNILAPTARLVHTRGPVTSLLKLQSKDEASQEKSQPSLPNMQDENQVEGKLKQDEFSEKEANQTGQCFLTPGNLLKKNAIFTQIFNIKRASQERRALVKANMIAPGKKWRICSPPRQGLKLLVGGLTHLSPAKRTSHLEGNY